MIIWNMSIVRMHYRLLLCYINGLVQDCNISIANTLEKLKPCIKASICFCFIFYHRIQTIYHIVTHIGHYLLTTEGSLMCGAYHSKSTSKYLCRLQGTVNPTYSDKQADPLKLKILSKNSLSVFLLNFKRIFSLVSSLGLGIIWLLLCQWRNQYEYMWVNLMHQLRTKNHSIKRQDHFEIFSLI